LHDLNELLQELSKVRPIALISAENGEIQNGVRRDERKKFLRAKNKYPARAELACLHMQHQVLSSLPLMLA
jgi:hypothetical protein